MTNLLQITINARKSIININVHGNSCAKSHSNSSISVTIQNQWHVHVNFLSSQRPILSPPTLLTFSLNHLVCISIDEKNYSNKNSFASPVFPIHVFIAISSHSSHNVMLTYFMNITYLLIDINHPNFSILSASNNRFKLRLSSTCTSHEGILDKYRYSKG